MFSSPVRGAAELSWSGSIEIPSDDSFFESMAKTSIATDLVFSKTEKTEFVVPDVFYSFDSQRYERNIKPLRQQEASVDSLRAKL